MHGGAENEGTIFCPDVEPQNIIDHRIMNGDQKILLSLTWTPHMDLMKNMENHSFTPPISLKVTSIIL